MSSHLKNETTASISPSRLARWVLTSFLLTFMIVRILVYLIMSRRLPDFYVQMGGTHVHHLNFGIVLLAVIGAILLFRRIEGNRLLTVAAVYGVGLALTFDEFGMWLHLGGSYWQRASWDAVAVVGGLLALMVVAPRFRQWRVSQRWTVFVLVLLLAVFSLTLTESILRWQRTIGPKLMQIEDSGPH